MGALRGAGEGPLARLGLAITDFCERYFPDAFVFALAGVLVVFVVGLLIGEPPVKLVNAFGNGFWELMPFTMQMALIIIGGFVVASSPPVARLIGLLASLPKTARGAVAFTALFSMLSSLISWGLSLVFSGLLVREICRRIERVDYRAIGAAAYLGSGSVWALGLSSSAALLQATPASIPQQLRQITGVIPLSETLFLWQSMSLALILMVVSMAVAYWSAPTETESRTAADVGVRFEPLEAMRVDKPVTAGDRWEHSPALSVAIGALMLVYLLMQISQKGLISTLDLNNFNFAFLTAGLLLHWRPRSFLNAVRRSVPATGGVLIQFPFYAGIFGLISKTAITTVLADLFVRLSTQSTLPLLAAAYSAVLGLFVPSGGAKWIIEAPYVMTAANTWHVHLGWMVQIYNAAEALPNLINPFWMLPLMGILNVKARDLAGYSILQLLMHIPIVLFFAWFFASTLAYHAPL